MSDKHIIKKQFEKCSTAILLSSSAQGISLCAWLLGDICSFMIYLGVYTFLFIFPYWFIWISAGILLSVSIRGHTEPDKQGSPLVGYDL